MRISWKRASVFLLGAAYCLGCWALVIGLAMWATSR